MNRIQFFFSTIFLSLRTWVTTLSIRRVKTKFIKAYLIDVRSAYVNIEFENLIVFHSAQLKRVINDTRRLRDEDEIRERCLITKNVLLRLLKCFYKIIKHNITIQIVFYLVFIVFLRISEFIYESKDLRDENFDNWFLTRHHVRLYEDHLELTLSAFKTNSFRQGVTLFVLDTNDEICVVRALRYLFNKWSTSLFSPLFAIDESFIKRTITHNLRLTLRFSDLSDHYSNHFFRRGAAITARLTDLSEDEIKLLDR